MSARNSTAPAVPGKPDKPTPNYPLFPDATKHWAKATAGRMVSFGPWSNPDRALGRYRDYIAGKPMPARATPETPEVSGRPNKPRPDFPLFAHATGRWAKKIRGKLHYFGPWADPDAALRKYLEQREALHAGRKPREESAGLTVKEMCNRFLNAKQALVDSAELTNRSWQDYKAACDLVVAHFGKGRLVSDLDPNDFAGLRGKLSRRWGPVTLGNVIQR